MSGKSLSSGANLCGRQILFVGGRHQAVAHLRNLVESMNGSFDHHDGGVEESMTRLGKLVDRADVVLFPVTCVSHAAQSKVKSLCRSQSKRFIPLRSMGMTTIGEALRAL